MATSIQDRINALNLGHVRTGPPPAKPPAANKPQLPPRLPPRSASTQDVRTAASGNGDPNAIGNLPNQASSAPPPPQRAERSRLPLPPPRQSAYPPKPPALPARNNGGASQALVRQDSSESISSTLSARSSLSVPSTHTSVTSPSTRSPSIDMSRPARSVKAPAFDPASLPPLPPKQQPQQPARPGLKSSNSSSRVVPSRPPILPSRQGPTTTGPPTPSPAPAPQPARPSSFSQPTPAPRKSALSYGMNTATELAPAIPERASLQNNAADTSLPPPLPMSSRPDLAALQASKPKAPFNTASTSSPPPTDCCWKCRDFSAPDNHAARFPRESIPSTDVHWLAQQLTSPFRSDTDRARALFTWCHHNIAYNAEAFFSGNLKPSTPASTISTGLAVCEGYAGLFNAMALAVGLESVVIGGHGMGFAKKPVAPSDPTPPEDASGHAWNVVKIDGGEWKLIDVCWGAGHLGDDRLYHKAFHPDHFGKPNDLFGLSHFPKDPAHQFRADGRTMSWDEYIRGGPDAHVERVTVYTGCRDTHGLDDTGFTPRLKHIKVRGAPPAQRIQFAFRAVCEHWDSVARGIGRPYMFLLAVGGRDGRKRENIPVRTDGRHWWVDVAVQDLGCAGQSVMLYAVTTVAGSDARGMTLREYEGVVGRKAMSFGGVAAWQLI